MLRERAVQAQSCGGHVPELATHKIALFRVVMEDWREARVGMGLRLSCAETRPNGAGIGDRRLVEPTDRSGETGLRHVAETTALVPLDREFLVVEDYLPE